MYRDCIAHFKKCPQCVIDSQRDGKENQTSTSSHTSTTSFSNFGSGCNGNSEAENCHVVVFQDFLTKRPLVFPVPDRKATR